MAINITNMTGILSGGSGFDSVFMLVAFAAFVYVAFKALHVIKNTVFVAILSLAFPFVMNSIFSAGMDTSTASLMFFMTAGVFLYVIYEGLKLIFHASKFFMAIISLIFLPFVIILKIIGMIFGSGDNENKVKKKKKNKHNEDD